MELDYKKLYEELMQRARELHEGGNALTKQQMEIVCPELAESEDKRVNEEIRNFLIDMECKREWIAYLEKQKVNTEGDFARGYDCGYECCLNSHGAEWLEKQKEQKPAEYITDAEMKRSMNSLHDFKVFAANLAKQFNITHKRDIDWHNFCAGLLTYLERNKPTEWSEEDKRKLNMLYSIVSQAADAHAFFTTTRLISDRDAIELHDFLKSLCPQHHWKPSEEQMEALWNTLHPDDPYYVNLSSLYNDLKKL